MKTAILEGTVIVATTSRVNRQRSRQAGILQAACVSRSEWLPFASPANAFLQLGREGTGHEFMAQFYRSKRSLWKGMRELYERLRLFFRCHAPLPSGP